MKRTKKIIAILLVMAMALSFGACTKDDSDDKALVITDMTGREVSMDAPAEKVVVLTAGDCEIVYALGCGDKVVGRGEYCNYPEEVYDVVTVKSGAETNVEEVIALEPDAVIMGKMDQSEEQVNALEKAGIKTFVSDANNIEETYEAIEMVGKILGAEEKASELIQNMKDSFAEITVNETQEEVKTVYFEVSPLEYGLWTAGNNTYMNEICEMLGAKNIFEDVDGWAQISQEQVIERNPDYIVTITMYYGEGPTPVEEIMGRAGWEGISAIQNEKVFNANSDEISRPAPRLVDAAKALAEFLK